MGFDRLDFITGISMFASAWLENLGMFRFFPKANTLPITSPVKSPFIILGSHRTGSNWLQEILDNHPDCSCFGEYLNPGKGATLVDRFFEQSHGRVGCPTQKQIRRRPLDCLDLLYTELGREVETEALGFRLFYNHLNSFQYQDLVKRLKLSGGFKIIHLQRRNVLRSYISLQIAKNQGKWRLKKDEAEIPLASRAIFIDPKQANRYVKNVILLRKKFPKIFQQLPVHEVWYEDVANKMNEQVFGIFDFLKLAPKEPKSSLLRMNPEPLTKLVLNWEECVRKFKGTPWFWMINDENQFSAIANSKET